MRALMLALGALITLSFGAAHAASQAKVDAMLDTARTDFRAKRPAEALKRLDTALAQSTQWAAYQSRIQLFRARCLIDLHRPDEAREALERYIGSAPTAKDKRIGRTWLAKVQRRFYGSMRVQCTDGARRISIAGVPGKPRRCPAQWDGLNPGRYVLHLTGGGAPSSRSIELFAGQRLTHDLNKNTQSRSKIKAPVEHRFGWGLFGRAGLSTPGATLPAPASVTQGLTAEAGAWAHLLWPIDRLALGVRLEFGYRFWSAQVASDGADARVETITTHGLVLPVLAELELPWSLALRAGPAVTFVVQAESDGAVLETDPLGLMAVAGVAWRLPIETLNLGMNLRYDHALTKIFEHTTLRRHQAQLGLEWGW